MFLTSLQKKITGMKMIARALHVILACVAMTASCDRFVMAHKVSFEGSTASSAGRNVRPWDTSAFLTKDNIARTLYAPLCLTGVVMMAVYVYIRFIASVACYLDTRFCLNMGGLSVDEIIVLVFISACHAGLVLATWIASKYSNHRRVYTRTVVFISCVATSLLTILLMVPQH